MIARFLVSGFLAISSFFPRSTTIAQTGVVPDRLDPVSVVQIAEPVAPPPTPAEIAVAAALEQVGKKYRWATRGPDTFDCSGLMSFAWAAAGYDFRASTYSQWQNLPHYPIEDLQPGDILFTQNLGHVYMYVGDGQVIHAPGTGYKVKVISMPSRVRKEVVRPTG